jgi:LysR family transcriptional regulator for metE and metH
MSAMHIEFRHLRSIKAIHDTGGLARAAEVLGLTQSALSHQIKGIEDQAGVELFVRRSKPLKLSPAGKRLLAAAQRILPEVEAVQAEFEGLVQGRAGRLHIAIECHACFEWLFPVLEQFRRAWPETWTSAPGWPSRPCPPSPARKWTWSSPPTPRKWAA